MKPKNLRQLLVTAGAAVLFMAALAGILWGGSALIPPPEPRPMAAYAGISLLGPQDRTFAVDTEDARVSVLISGVRGLPQRDKEVHFSVISGPASFPDGTETTFSNDRGIAETQELELTGKGIVTLEVEIELLTVEFEIEVTASQE